jgi:hypothetical protein
MVFCTVIVVGMLESRVARCVHCDEDVVSSNETQPDLLTMGVKTLETC